MEQQEQVSAEVDWMNKKIKLTGNDWATIVAAIGVIALCVGFYFHHVDAKEGRADTITVMKELAAAIKEQTSTQKEQNCLMVNRARFKVEETTMLESFCRSNTR